MPDLIHTLQGHDLGFLKIVSESWGLPLEGSDLHTVLPSLVSAILEPSLANEVIATLPESCINALGTLLETNGRMPWAVFSRRFGEVRAYGAARRDRERPDRNPSSPAEVLWYRALIGKAFLNLSPEPQEYAYIPDDLLPFMKIIPTAEPALPGRPASPGETRVEEPATDEIVDDLCTLLALIRAGREDTWPASPDWEERLPFYRLLLQGGGFFSRNGSLQTDLVRKSLEAPRGQALVQLVLAWLNSKTLNDLRLIPGLVFEGDWQNDPISARKAILELIHRLPSGSWWNLASFVEDIRRQNPDFQRPGGDYDSWFIRKDGSQSYLRGVSSWPEVDGALIRFLLCGPLHWLGVIDLAAAGKNTSPLAFRLSAWGAALLEGKAPTLAQEQDRIEITPDNRFKLERLASRALRYQVARFCEWDRSFDGKYWFSLTPTSLEKALQQGLLPSHLLKVLKRASQKPLAPALVQSLERWEKFGVEAGFQNITLLRVSNPEILDALRNTMAQAALMETISPTMVILKPGSEEAVRKALAGLGYLAESRLTPGKRL